MPSTTMRSLLPLDLRIFKDLLSNLLGIEVLGRQCPGTRTLLWVICGNCFQRPQSIIMVAETEQPFGVRQVRAWARILNHRRLAACQVTHRPVADPRVLKSHARRLGTTELPARVLNVLTIGFCAAGHF